MEVVCPWLDFVSVVAGFVQMTSCLSVCKGVGDYVAFEIELSDLRGKVLFHELYCLFVCLFVG